MKPTTVLSILSAFCAAVLLGCSGINVTSDAVGSTFDTYQRFGWHQDTSRPDTDIGRLVHEQILTLVDEGLKSKGYQKADTADFFVNYEVTADDVVDIQKHKMYSGYGPGFVWRLGEGMANEVMTQNDEIVINTVRKGTLIIDVIDAKTNKLVWRAVADKELEGRLNNQQRETQLQAAVNKLLEAIPAAK